MRYVLVGGTGTLGRALTAYLLRLKTTKSILCISRDELKQKEFKSHFKDARISTSIADVRDKATLVAPFRGADCIFHVAALKHIDVVEEQPFEGLKTNIIGTINVAEEAIAQNVGHVVFSSTDKAVLPINAYGMTKAFSERYLFQCNREQDITKFSVFRWGNVLGSRGSVVHAFLDTLNTKRMINITDMRMTRFWIDINEAARFMIENYKYAAKDMAMIPPMKSASVLRLAAMCAASLGVADYKINVVGIREGEKIHECIHSSHDECIRSDNTAEYTDEELLEMIRRVP